MDKILILFLLFLISCSSFSKKEEVVPTKEVEVTKEEIPTPKEEQKYDEVGLSSWYGEQFQNKPTASGELFDRFKLTAAHRTLPFGTAVRVHNLDNQKETLVRINDRGPYNKTRIIDVSEKAAEILDFKEVGVARVGLKIVKENTEEKATNSSLSENIQAKKTRDEDAFSLDEDEDEEDEEEDEDLLSPPKKESKKPTIQPNPIPEKKPAPASKTVVPTKEVETEKEKPTTKAEGPQPKGFTVQIGVFKEKKRAENFRSQIQASFSETIYMFNRAGMYVVQIGDFKTRAEAVVLRDKLKAKGVFGFIPPK